ncbi:16S rRNA (guanine(966)-N(2))-methyltransferase RsmD [Spiroplasma endosymbiont of Crioceris asparagi]|uniref:16S rRNA (guanine(966)-N(2))-methyltransferase RsmD n=1 Tax=Spiroplasma endosymbiont of Crioceris asparagi TaxID=3066286 RepID=UPI0030D53626
MKIISGKYKGRKLVALETNDTRPTLTRVKEDIFNVLNSYFIFENKTCLDLFAGSGSLAIECISRNIKFAYINDNNSLLQNVIKENLKNIPEIQYSILNKDYHEALDFLINNNIKIDLLFLDPPYSQLEVYNEVISKILENNMLNNYGIIVCESSLNWTLNSFNNLVLLKNKKYNKLQINIFRLEVEN